MVQRRIRQLPGSDGVFEIPPEQAIGTGARTSLMVEPGLKGYGPQVGAVRKLIDSDFAGVRQGINELRKTCPQLCGALVAVPKFLTRERLIKEGETEDPKSYYLMIADSNPNKVGPVPRTQEMDSVLSKAAGISMGYRSSAYTDTLDHYIDQTQPFQMLSMFPTDYYSLIYVGVDQAYERKAQSYFDKVRVDSG